MPGDTVDVPVAGQGADPMSIDATEVSGDLDQDCCELLLESLMQTHEAITTEITANSEAAANIVRLSGARKFNREDPLEAAAAEVIMRKKV